MSIVTYVVVEDVSGKQLAEFPEIVCETVLTQGSEGTQDSQSHNVIDIASQSSARQPLLPLVIKCILV